MVVVLRPSQVADVVPEKFAFGGVGCAYARLLIKFVQFVDHSDVERVEVDLDRLREVPDQIVVPVPGPAFQEEGVEERIVAREAVLRFANLPVHHRRKAERIGVRIEVQIAD